MYNGIPISEVTSAGCGKLDIGVIAERGVVGRCVLLEIGARPGGALEPGTAILVQDLETRSGVSVSRSAPATFFSSAPAQERAIRANAAPAFSMKQPAFVPNATSSPVNPIAIF